MPNYNIVVNTSNFKPFSFQDKIAPLVMYNQSYDKLNEKLEKYAEDYGTIPETGDEILDNTVKEYNDRLRALSDRFANGMTTDVGNDLTKMFIEGKQKLAPIKQAISDYNDYVDKVEKLGPDAIFKKQYKIGDFYNKQRSPLEYKSASEIQKQAKNYFEGIQNLYAQAPEIIGSLGNGYDLIQKGTPLNREDIMKIIAKGMNSPSISDNKVSEGIMEGLDYLYHNLGIDEYDYSAKQKVQDNLILGLMQAVKAPEFSTQRKEKPEKREKTDKEKMFEYIGEYLVQNGHTDVFDENDNFDIDDDDYQKYQDILKNKPTSGNPGANNPQAGGGSGYSSSITGNMTTEELLESIRKDAYKLSQEINDTPQNLTNADIVITTKQGGNDIKVFLKDAEGKWSQESLEDADKDKIRRFMDQDPDKQESTINQMESTKSSNKKILNIYKRIYAYGSSAGQSGGSGGGSNDNPAQVGKR